MAQSASRVDARHQARMRQHWSPQQVPTGSGDVYSQVMSNVWQLHVLAQVCCPLVGQARQVRSPQLV